MSPAIAHIARSSAMVRRHLQLPPSVEAARKLREGLYFGLLLVTLLIRNQEPSSNNPKTKLLHRPADVPARRESHCPEALSSPTFGSSQGRLFGLIVLSDFRQNMDATCSPGRHFFFESEALASVRHSVASYSFRTRAVQNPKP